MKFILLILFTLTLSLTYAQEKKEKLFYEAGTYGFIMFPQASDWSFNGAGISLDGGYTFLKQHKMSVSTQGFFVKKWNSFQYLTIGLKYTYKMDNQSPYLMFSIPIFKNEYSLASSGSPYLTEYWKHDNLSWHDGYYRKNMIICDLGSSIRMNSFFSINYGIKGFISKLWNGQNNYGSAFTFALQAGVCYSPDGLEVKK